MSPYGPKRTRRSASTAAAFGGKASALRRGAGAQTQSSHRAPIFVRPICSVSVTRSKETNQRRGGSAGAGWLLALTDNGARLSCNYFGDLLIGRVHDHKLPLHHGEVIRPKRWTACAALLGTAAVVTPLAITPQL